MSDQEENNNQNESGDSSGDVSEEAPRSNSTDGEGGAVNRKSATSVFNYGFFLFVIVVAILINSRMELLWGDRNSTSVNEQVPTQNTNSVKPKYVLYNAQGKGKSHLKHVEIVLRRFGYEEADLNTSSSDWTLMWAHDYPFNNVPIDFKSLQPCQRVNHIPGCGFITNKVDLSTTRLKYIPRAFKLPQQTDQLLDYARANPEKLFVHKHNQHRHIRVRKLEEIDFSDKDNFIQEFIGNPLLVDGYKFDIGVYAIITSVDPLRVYYYSGDILFRFCALKYHPFDPDNVNKYIVGDDYLPIWSVPSLSQYYNTQRHGMRDSFNLYMKSKGRDPKIIWDQIEESIRLMVLNKEKHLVDILKRYKSKRNFFELIRIDFVVDDDLKVFMMEANMSPNLSAAHFPPNQLLYEQVLFNSLKMAGLAFPQQGGNCSGSPSANQMMSSNKNIVVNGEMCSEMPCRESCAPVKCALCFPCLTDNQKQNFYDAASEHLNRGDTKRVVPAAVNELKKLPESEWQQMSMNNQLMARWFLAKCEADSSWCY